MSKHGTALSVGQFAEFSAAVIKALPRDIDPDVALNWANNGAALKKVLAQALCPPESETSREVFSILIDYSQSLADMIKAGNYDWVNREITAKRFPPKGEGVVSRDLGLCHYNRVITSEEVTRVMAEAGQEPGTIEDALAFGARYPEEQRKYPIIALGSSAGVHGDRGVPYLDGRGSWRDLNLGWFGSGWGEGCRFLARNKVSGT